MNIRNILATATLVAVLGCAEEQPTMTHTVKTTVDDVVLTNAQLVSYVTMKTPGGCFYQVYTNNVVAAQEKYLDLAAGKESDRTVVLTIDPKKNELLTANAGHSCTYVVKSKVE